jgi:chemotaxis protein MotB
MQKMSLLLSLVALLVSGCTTPASFLSIGNDCLNIQEELLQCEEKNLELQDVVVDMELKAAGLADYTTQLEKDNAFLYRKVEDLNRTVGRQKSVISLQKTVIRLFDDSNHSMQKNIEEQIATQKSSVNPQRKSDRWVFANDSLFANGGTDLSASGKEKLRKVAHELGRKDDFFIRVEGHADDRPLKETASYANNWELSALRAAAVVTFLQEDGDVPAECLSATGYGYYQPVVSNASQTGRRQNSRVEIIVEQSE